LRGSASGAPRTTTSSAAKGPEALDLAHGLDRERADESGRDPSGSGALAGVLTGPQGQKKADRPDADERCSDSVARMHGDAGDPGAQRHHEGDLADLENLYCSQRTEREGDAMHNETSDA
jgi:hypothetical protein